MSKTAELTIKRQMVDENFDALLNTSRSIYGVLLSSTDGHALAKKATNEFAESKLAAMTSSCLALGEKIAMEAKQNHCDFVIIQNDDGYLVLKRVGKRLVITALADRSINLGMLLSATRSVSESMEKEITF